MTEQEARNLLMEYLYDEIDESRKKEFKEFVREHPEFRKELDELSQTQHLLRKAPGEIPPPAPVSLPAAGTVSAKSPEAQNRKKRGFFRLHPPVQTVVAVAASLLVILMTSALTGLQLGQTEHGFYLSFGSPGASVPTGISEDDVLMLLEQIREENRLLMEAMADQIQTRQAAQFRQIQSRQNEQLEEALNLLAGYYEEQRRQDLMMISRGLSTLEQQTNDRFMKTGEALEDLIYAMYQTGQ